MPGRLHQLKRRSSAHAARMRPPIRGGFASPAASKSHRGNAASPPSGAPATPKAHDARARAVLSPSEPWRGQPTKCELYSSTMSPASDLSWQQRR